MDKGYYVVVDGLENGKLDGLEILLQDIGIKNTKIFQSIGRVYAVMPEELAKKLSEKYVVEPEPEMRKWI